MSITPRGAGWSVCPLALLLFTPGRFPLKLWTESATPSALTQNTIAGAIAVENLFSSVKSGYLPKMITLIT